MFLSKKPEGSDLAEKIAYDSLESLQKFARDLKWYDPADTAGKEAFMVIVSSAPVRGVSTAKIADAFKTTTSSVERWGNGKSVPPEEIRRVVVEEIKKMAEKEIKEIESLLELEESV